MVQWWRRRELNPRPQALCHRLYMLIPGFSLTDCYPPGEEDRQRFWCLFSALTPDESPSRFYESDAGMFPKEPGRIDTAPVQQQSTGY